MGNGIHIASRHVNRYNSVGMCVTVVDSSMFFGNLDTNERLRVTDLAVAMETDEHISQHLVSQIESSDIILLSKTNLLDDEAVQTVQAAVMTLNARARVIPCASCKVCHLPTSSNMSNRLSRVHLNADPLAQICFAKRRE